MLFGVCWQMGMKQMSHVRLLRRPIVPSPTCWGECNPKIPNWKKVGRVRISVTLCMKKSLFLLRDVTFGPDCVPAAGLVVGTIRNGPYHLPVSGVLGLGFRNISFKGQKPFSSLEGRSVGASLPEVRITSHNWRPPGRDNQGAEKKAVSDNALALPALSTPAQNSPPPLGAQTLDSTVMLHLFIFFWFTLHIQLSHFWMAACLSCWRETKERGFSCAQAEFCRRNCVLGKTAMTAEVGIQAWGFRRGRFGDGYGNEDSLEQAFLSRTIISFQKKLLVHTMFNKISNRYSDQIPCSSQIWQSVCLPNNSSRFYDSLINLKSQRLEHSLGKRE